MTDLLSVKFTASNAVHGRRPYTIYEIEVRSTTTMPWLLYKRYRDFDLLHAQLTKLIHSNPDFAGVDVKLNELPPKRLVRSMAPDVVAKRQKELEEYVTHLLSNAILIRQLVLLDFLTVPESLRAMLMRRNTDYGKARSGSDSDTDGRRGSESYGHQYTSPEEKQVSMLLKELSLQRNRVKALCTFEKWYFEKKDPPTMKPDLIRTLFMGDDTYQGLAYSCKLLHSKVAWRGSISLLVRLLDIERNKYARVFQEVFRTLDQGIFKEMDLHRHIKDATQEDGFKIVSLIKQLVPELDIKYYVPNEQALRQFEKWQKVQIDSSFVHNQTDTYFNDNTKNETYFAFNWQESNYQSISEEILLRYKELTAEKDVNYMAVDNPRFTKGIKVRYKKERYRTGATSVNESAFLEKWKLKITFVVNHKPSDVYQFLLDDINNTKHPKTAYNSNSTYSGDESKGNSSEDSDVELEYPMASSWNKKIVEQKVDKKLDDHHFVVHSTYKTFNSPYKFRDFVCLYYTKTDLQAQRYMILFSSIYNYEDLPEFKNRDRTSILPSGFEIRATQHDPNVSHVSFRSVMTAGSVSLVSADLLLETDELFSSMMNIDVLLTKVKHARKSIGSK